MKHYLPDMELFNNARLRPVVKTPGGFVRQAGNADNAAIAGNDGSFAEERLFGFPLPALSAITAFTAF